MKQLILYLIPVLTLLTLFYCTNSARQEYRIFPDKSPQESTERSTTDLTLVDSLHITEAFDSWTLSDIKLSEASIFAKLEDRIIKLNKENLSTEDTLTIPEGRGPGEVVNSNEVRFDIGNKGLAVYDRNASKTALYDLNGNFREEFLNGAYPVRKMVMADEQVYYIQLFPGSEYLFYEVKRKKSESEITRRFQKQSDNIEILAYNGSITYHNQSFYFAGYSEPLIRRYDLSGDTTELVFSRAVIDDYNSENNYRKPERSSNVQVWDYTDEAQYASRDIAVDDNYLYSVRHHNDEEGYKYLDIYDVEDGSYRGSFSLQYYPTEIAVDENHTYTKEFKNGELEQKYLMKYEKPEMNF
jgi:hypothetical protein